MELNKKIFSKGFKEHLDKKATEDKLSFVPENLIHLLNNDVVSYCLNQKRKPTNSPTARVLNHWIKSQIIDVDVTKKNKIKHFNIVERVWLNIVMEMRDFGISLDSIERIKKIMLEYIVDNFSLLKFQILNCILFEEQILVAHKDGDANIYSKDIYFKFLSKKSFLPHLSLPLKKFIEKEYPDNYFDREINIHSLHESTDRMLLLYFLKTGDYQYMKVQLNENDVRFLENTLNLIDNEELYKRIREWNFMKIFISINDEMETVISNSK